MTVERLGQHRATKRDVFFAALPSAQRVNDIVLPSPHFVTLLAWNAEGEPVGAVSSVLEGLFAAGASYLCAWGSDCGRVHDIADEIDSYPSELASPDDAVRMTTWHEHETLSEAVQFFLEDTEPNGYYAGWTQSALALCIGSGMLAAQVRQVIEDQLNEKGSA
jgi:hypothetical protein